MNCTPVPTSLIVHPGHRHPIPIPNPPSRLALSRPAPPSRFTTTTAFRSKPIRQRPVSVSRFVRVHFCPNVPRHAFAPLPLPISYQHLHSVVTADVCPPSTSLFSLSITPTTEHKAPAPNPLLYREPRNPNLNLKQPRSIRSTLETHQDRPTQTRSSSPDLLNMW